MAILHTPAGYTSVNYPFGSSTGSGFAPTDNTNHYIGLAGSPTNTAPTGATSVTPIVRKACLLTDIYLTIIVAGTNGSGENGSLMVRVNDTTDTTVFNNTLAWNVGVAGATHTANGLTIALAPGDFFTLKIDPPTWVTNPTGVFYLAQVVIAYPS